MRVAFFADSLPPSTDGVARTMARLADTLQKEKIDHIFFSPFQPGDEYSWSTKVIPVLWIPFILYPHYRVSLPLKYQVRAHLDEFKPDLIHATSPTLLGLTGLSYAREHNIPAVASYHTDFVSYMKYYGFGIAEKLGWNLLRNYYNNFARIYAPSHTTADQLSTRGFTHIDIWQRGIDTDLFSPKRRDADFRNTILKSDEQMILFVGRLVKEKDLDVFIHLDRILRSRGRKFRFVFVGGGPYRAVLEKALPSAHFPGFQHGETLARWFASADIFLFPSTTETFGNVILEAGASGIPTIISNQGGVVDLIRDGLTGFKAQANDVEDFARKTEKLLIDHDLRIAMGRQARKYVSRFDWYAINRKLLNSYQMIINKN